MPVQKNPEEPSKPRRRLRRVVTVLVIALAVTIVIDGYFNRWDAALSLLHWRTLALQSDDGIEWKLGTSNGMTVLRIADPARLVHLDSLRAFDHPYNTAGFYRLYFRRSDSLSSTVHALYQKLSEYDTTHTIDRTIFMGGRALHTLLRLVGKDTTTVADSYVPPPSMPERSLEGRSTPGPAADSIRIAGVWSGTTSDVTEAATKIVGRSPTAIIGIGLGVVAAAGLDLLKGEVYLAYASSDIFRLHGLTVGPRAGTWEGKEIDILWLFAPGDLQRAERDTTRPAQ